MTHSDQKTELSDWFYALQTDICKAFEDIEDSFPYKDLPAGTFIKSRWDREDQVSKVKGGGGMMAVMKGRVFEKVGVNVSVVEGQFSPEFAGQVPGASKENPHFWASGISLVAHPLNPFVPAVHMNTRHIVTTKSWFGGGTDLTPTFEFKDDTHLFHRNLQDMCDKHSADYYPRFKEWCDKYFYLPHRQEPRGIGGIFYDDLNSGSYEKDFSFTRDVGLTFLKTYTDILKKRAALPWTQDDKLQQLQKRSRYVEFNLIHDRGTKFGLQTNGNIDAIMMSMPPTASWD